ncbi:hypothetical protein V8C86DRAFT_2959574 [Haematococcus lacustris]
MAGSWAGKMAGLLLPVGLVRRCSAVRSGSGEENCCKAAQGGVGACTSLGEVGDGCGSRGGGQGPLVPVPTKASMPRPLSTGREGLSTCPATAAAGLPCSLPC